MTQVATGDGAEPRRAEFFRALEKWALLDRAGAPSAARLRRPVVAIVPAAGRGTRLDFDGPKALFPFEGKPILRRIHDSIADLTAEFCVVVSPRGKAEIEGYAESQSLDISFAVQASPTGMGDAVLQAEGQVEHRAPDCDFLIVWGDQVGLSRQTALACLLWHQHSLEGPAITFPTCLVADPYIHFVRDAEGRIVDLLEGREGDIMPGEGESDCGLFICRGEHFFAGLREYRAVAEVGRSTRELNFLPFVVWLANRGECVHALPIAGSGETRGINTRQDAFEAEEDRGNG